MLFQLSTNYNIMHSALPPEEGFTLLRPAKYLASTFKAYILEHLLQQLVGRAVLPALLAIKQAATLLQTAKSQRKRMRNAKIRTEWDEHTVGMAQSHYQYSSSYFYQLTPKHQSPYRESERGFKTQFYEGSYNIGSHLLRQENASASQLIISDQSEYLCPAEHRQLVSPYRKKDNISIVDVNYSAERIIKILSPHEKDVSESRVRVQEEKSRRMTEKVKKCAVRLMATTIKYAAHRLQLNFFRNVRVVRIIKERDESVKAQQLLKAKLFESEARASKAFLNVQVKDKQIEQYRKQLKAQKIAKELQFKLAVLTKIELRYGYLLRSSFTLLASLSETRFVAVGSQSDEQQEYTIVYANDEELGPSLSSKLEATGHLYLNLSAERGQTEKVSYSHRSGATNSSYHHD